jgi:hypothetical protein
MPTPVDPALQVFWQDVGYLGDRVQAGANLLYEATVREHRAQERNRDDGWQAVNETLRAIIEGLEAGIIAPVSIITDFDAARVCSLLGFPKANFDLYWPLIAAELKARRIHTRPLLIALWATIARETGSFRPIAGRPNAVTGVTYGPRGFIQLATEVNYKSYTGYIQRDSRFKGINLLTDPDRASDPALAAWIAAEFVNRGGMPQHAATAYAARTDEERWRRVRAIVFAPAYLTNPTERLRVQLNRDAHFPAFYRDVQALLANESAIFS